MTGLEVLHDRHDRRGLCFVALVAADLKGEPVPIHQQADDDLRIDLAFLRVPDTAQLVLVLCLEVQSRRVIEDQRHITVRGRVGETGLGQPVPERVCLGPAQGALACRQPRRLPAEPCEDAISIEQTGRLDDTSDDEITEHPILDHVEAETRIHAGQCLIQRRCC